MTHDEQRVLRAHIASLRRSAAADELHKKKMLALLKKAMRSGGSKIAIRSNRTLRSATTLGRSTRGAGSWTKLGKTPSLLLKIHQGGMAGDSYATKQKDSELVMTNMLGQSAKDREQEFALDASRHPMVNPRNLYFHISLSRPERGRLSIDQWTEIVLKWLKYLGAEGCNYVAIRHNMTANDHVHIIFSRAKPDGTLLSDSNNRWTWRSALRKTESDLGMETPAIPRPTDRHVPTSDRMVNAQRRADRLKLPDGSIDPRVVQSALAGTVDFDQFKKRLLTCGIQVKQAEMNGRATGLLFQRSESGQWLAGSSISRDLSLPRVQATLLANSTTLQRAADERRLQQHRLASRRNVDGNPDPNFERDI